VHFVIGALLAALCSFGLTPVTERWRGFVRLLTLLALAAPFIGPGLDARAGAPGGTLLFFVWAVTLTVMLLGPAVAIWPQPGKGTGLALVSVLLGGVWFAAVQTILVVTAAWNQWGLCLPPAQVYPGASGPDGKSPDECVVYDP
jgi:hypothetical protein